MLMRMLFDTNSWGHGLVEMGGIDEKWSPMLRTSNLKECDETNKQNSRECLTKDEL